MRTLLLVGVLASACGGAAAGPRYSLQQFMTVHRANSGSLSPDGKHLVYITNTTGTWQAMLTSLDGGAPRQLTTT